MVEDQQPAFAVVAMEVWDDIGRVIDRGVLDAGSVVLPIIMLRSVREARRHLGPALVAKFLRGLADTLETPPEDGSDGKTE